MEPLRIVHLFPDLLNLYGDGGNVRCLEKRCVWREIPVEVEQVRYGNTTDFERADIVFLGGGPDREQGLASKELLRIKESLKNYVENDGVLLAICGGFQILGREWLLGNEGVEGLSILDMVTRGADGVSERLISDIALSSSLSTMPVIGYENHAGRTFLGDGLEPFGTVISSVGHGNNDTDKVDGVLYRNVLGTYLHGPLLAKNPQVADKLLEKALDLRRRRGEEPSILEPLNDEVEIAANSYMAKRLGPFAP